MRVLIACLLLSVGNVVLAAEPLPAPRISAPQPHVAGEPYRVGGDVARPEKVSGEAPAYTEEARTARVQGVVVLEAIIDENGDIAKIRVLKQLPLGLDKAALAAVSTWKFKPATLDGVPVKVYYTLTVNFQMEDDDPSDPLVLLGLLARERAAASPPADAERIRQLAADLTTRRQTVDEVAKRAQDDYGDRRAALLVGIAGYLWGQATSPTVAPQAQAGLLELTGKVWDEALEADRDLPETMALKALLLREQAKAATDPAVQADLATQSQQWSQAGLLIYQQTHPAPAPAAPAAP
jgi:TonB family protein